MIRSRFALGFATAMVAMLAVPAEATARQNKPFYGVSNQGGLSLLTPRDFDRMQRARVGTLRFLVNVDSVRGSDGSFHWQRIDYALGAAAERGVRGLPYIYQARGPRTRAQRRALARFAGRMAARYAPRGEFWRGLPRGAARRPIISWQILNEQNYRFHWGGRPSPRAYGRALKMVSRAIRQQHKGAKIVLGGLLGDPKAREACRGGGT